MYQQSYANQMPGVGTSVLNVNKAIWKAREGVRYLPGGYTIDGAKSRDPANTLTAANYPAIANLATSYSGVLQAGLLMGKLTAAPYLYAPSVLGLTGVLHDTSVVTTTMTLPAAVVAEIARRCGASGTFKITGPPTAAGTVATEVVTYSAIASTTTITITATSADFAAGSLIQPNDGSETIKTFVDEEDGIRVTDATGASLAQVQFPRIPIAGGVIYAANIVNYSSMDASVKAHVKTALKAVGPFAFNDDF